jgi:hypothetical protein
VFSLPASTIRLLWVRGQLKWVAQVDVVDRADSAAGTSTRPLVSWYCGFMFAEL